MPDLVDTNVLVRYLTGEPADQSQASARVIDGGAEILVSPVVLAETAYVLSSVYRVAREDVVDALVDVVQKENVEVLGLDSGLAAQALQLCRSSGRVSFADALLWAEARRLGAPVWTFDANFPRDGILTRRP